MAFDLPDPEFLKDAAERTFWTAAEAGLAYAVVTLSAIPKWWAIPIAAALASAKAFVAKKLNPTGGVSEAALPVGPLG